jgi:hypothetical protein
MSPEAAREALLRAMWHAHGTAGSGLRQPRCGNAGSAARRSAAADRCGTLHAAWRARAVEVVREVAAILLRARHSMPSSAVSWIPRPGMRVALAEALNATVLTDLKVGASRPIIRSTQTRRASCCA